MRRILFLSLALVALLGFVAPPDVSAQAAAPTPKFTITGLIDNVGTWTQNMSSSDLNANRNRDHQLYGRTRGRFDINTDTQGNLQIKWVYVEFPLPLVPFSSIVRLGAQPFATAANYKLATYANGDFAGVNLYTTISPTFKLQTTYVAVEERLVGEQT